MPVKGDITNFSINHQIFLGVACAVLLSELLVLIIYRIPIIDWVSHNLWVVLVPFAKLIFKKLLTLKLISFLKTVVILILNLSKLLVLKFFKTLGMRYGVFFSQNRWYWMRRAKVMFLRRGKQLIRVALRFWSVYSLRSKVIISIAFFPVIVTLFILGLSFNITRRTMVQKTQETAVFQMATSASKTNRGVKAWIAKLDRKTLEKIRDLTPRSRNKKL